MKSGDFFQAWDLISSWDVTSVREDQLRELNSSPRRPYVLFAMIRIAAFLADAADVSGAFAEELAQNNYEDAVGGVLNITDQILDALDLDDETRDNLTTIVGKFAREEAHQDFEVGADEGEPTTQSPPVVQRSRSREAEPVTAVSVVGRTMRMDEAPVFARVRVIKLGILDTSEDDLRLLGSTVITWTDMEKSDDMFAEVEVRGVLTPELETEWIVGEISWLGGDCVVEIVDPPRYAGQPEDLIPLAEPISGPANTGSPDGWPPLLWKSMPLYQALVPLQDSIQCVRTILCALTVAPDTFDVRPWLLAGLKARHAQMVRDSDLYSSREYDWRYREGPEWER